MKKVLSPSEKHSVIEVSLAGQGLRPKEKEWARAFSRVAVFRNETSFIPIIKARFASAATRVPRKKSERCWKNTEN